ncbi:hypothetical protein OSSY52_02410 [Tepiditoga spiralis]|uniref:Uncharacterized protein n=1 Tax=Tepiditoga spiralis TaxID=2108365 RepID=A0A7G1G1M2_9BACT|nr:hypothetical protein [Tepiditoga spiralis]BBE30100.1 hypothetical protein OSSY52_02410 [Tepiditoga spiralis]
MKIKKVFFIFIIYFLLIYFLNDISNKIFENEKIIYIGKVLFNKEKLVEMNSMPEYAKAVIKYSDGKMLVYIPKNTEYFRKILPDLKIIASNISVLEKKVIVPTFIESDTLKRSRVFEITKDVYYFIFAIFIAILGFVYRPFSSKKYFLLSFKYKKQFIIPIFMFSILSFFIYLTSYFFDYSTISIPFFIGVSIVFIENIFQNKIFRAMSLIILVFIPFVNDTYFIFIVSMIINLIVSLILLKKYNFIKEKSKDEKTGEVIENDRQDNND